MTITSNNRDNKQNVCKNVRKIFSGFNQHYLSPKGLWPENSKLTASFPSVLEGLIQLLTNKR